MKDKFALHQVAETKKREEVNDSRKYKEEYEKELAFWKRYISLLKANCGERALKLLESTKKPSETDEFTKFKSGLLGVKYTGDAFALNAEELTKDSLGKL